MESENKQNKTVLKKAICIFMTVLMLFSTFGGAVTVFATDDHGAVVETGDCGADGDNVTYVLYDDGTLVISGNGAMADYYYYEDNEDHSPFYYNATIKKVIVEDGVTSIGFDVFNNCANIENVTISDSIKVIKGYAFSNCEKLENIVIPDSVISIGDNAFDGTAWYSNQPSGLVYAGKIAYSYKNYWNMPENTSIKLLDNTISIADCAFVDCDNLISITLPESLKHIGNNAFSRCVNLNNIELPDGLSTIGNWAFEECESLTNIVIPNSVTSIGNCIFSGCSSLIDVALSNNLTNIGYGVFDYCTVLKSVTLPENFTTIVPVMFSGCSNLEKITIPENVTGICEEAFESCTNLKSVTIPCNVTYIEEDAFYNCRNLIDVYYDGYAEDWDKISISDGNSYLINAKIHFKSCEHENSVTENEISSTCTTVGYTAGTYCNDCEEWISGHEVVPAKGHKWTAATCTVAKTCSTCKVTEGAALGHNWTAATCTDAKTCSTCKATEGTALGHKEVAVPGKAATCTVKGLTEGKKCSVCGVITVAQKEIAATGHKEVALPAKAATYTADGLTAGKKCSVCGVVTVAQKKVARKTLGKVKNLKVKETTTSTVKLSWSKVTGAESYKVYYSTNGKSWKSVKATKNTATVKKLKSGTSYQFKVKAVAGKYSGTTSSVVKTATKVAKATVKSVKSSKAKQAVVIWKKVTGASGYVVEYSTSKKFTSKTTKKVTVKKGSTTKTTLKKLKSGTKYYVRVKAYKTVNKKAVYGSVSTAKTVKVK